MQKIKITYGQEILEIDKGTTYFEVTEKLKLQNVLAAQVGYEVYPLDAKITESSTISFLDVTSLAGYSCFKVPFLCRCFRTLSRCRSNIFAQCTKRNFK